MHTAVNAMVCTFCELKEKAVINICNGKQLGLVCNMELDIVSGRILRLVVDCGGGFISLFSSKNLIYIPWQCIERIGDDAILVKFSEISPK